MKLFGSKLLLKPLAPWLSPYFNPWLATSLAIKPLLGIFPFCIFAAVSGMMKLELEDNNGKLNYCRVV